MTIKNTAKDYGSVAKWLHWATAVLFLAGLQTRTAVEDYSKYERPDPVSKIENPAGLPSQTGCFASGFFQFLGRIQPTGLNFLPAG